MGPPHRTARITVVTRAKHRARGFLSASGEPSLQDLWENQGSAVKGSDPLTPNKGVLSVKNAALVWNVFQD